MHDDHEFPWEPPDPALARSASEALAAELATRPPDDPGDDSSTPAPAADVVMTPRSVEPPPIH